MSEDRDKLQAEVVQIARGILNKTVGITEGAQSLTSLAHRLKTDTDSDFKVFIGIDSQTDEFPLGEVRHRWNSEARARYDSERQKAEELFRQNAERACQNLIQKYDPEKVSGIGGIFFRVRNPERMSAWYREHLGIPAEDGNADFLWREHDRPDEVGRTIWSLFPADTDYFGPSRPAFMINYRVTNLDRMLEQLRSKGIAVEKVEDFDYGRFAWISDPEGNRIELWEPKGK